MDALLRETFRYPETVSRVHEAFFVNTGSIRFECYPEIGDSLCHDLMPRICAGDNTSINAQEDRLRLNNVSTTSTTFLTDGSILVSVKNIDRFINHLWFAL